MQFILNEEAILNVAGLIVDAVAVGEALLVGDLDEARFRTCQVAEVASVHGMTEVRTAAAEVTRCLGGHGEQPRVGYASAVVELSEAQDRALAKLRA